MVDFTKEKMAVVSASVLLVKTDRGNIDPAVEALIKLGKPVVPFLVKKLSDKNELSHIREIASRALGNIGDISAMPALIAFIKEESISEGQAGIRAMGKKGVPALLEAVKDPKARPTLLKILVDLGAGTEAILIIRKLIKHEPDMRAIHLKSILVVEWRMRQEGKSFGLPQKGVELDSLDLKRFPSRQVPAGKSKKQNAIPAKKPAVV